jgi:DTW domain-containing protein YfiP
MHETELWRPSNTGYLATLMLPNSGLRIHGERGKMLEVDDWIEPTHRAFVLFPDAHALWLNPVLAEEWPYTRTISQIREIFPMFELTLDGLEKAVSHMMRKN